MFKFVELLLADQVPVKLDVHSFISFLIGISARARFQALIDIAPECGNVLRELVAVL